ncbi:MAG: ribosome silencing factor [Hyphomicrobiales bacterium]|nr:ribosome silencing factor [Rhabdaerophilum calidifontis]MCA1951861.1 ribosome silencing factor [Hyphomicrobiales bacterium]MCA1999779.1 ribosome silencing factor [Hyphomicrobiales bacterium]
MITTHLSKAADLPPVASLGAAAPAAGPLVEALKGVLDDAKAEDIVALDLAGKTSLADAMLIATGRSDRHVGAVAERVVQALKERGLASPRVEGMPVCDWVLIDAGDVIVHLFRPEVRGFYNLEKLWGAGRPLEGEAESAPRAVRTRSPRIRRAAE